MDKNEININNLDIKEVNLDNDFTEINLDNDENSNNTNNENINDEDSKKTNKENLDVFNNNFFNSNSCVKLISSNSNQVSLFNFSKPRNIFEGCISLISNSTKATVSTLSIMAYSPYIGYKMNGIKGFGKGLTFGALCGSVLFIVGNVISFIQITRGIINTEEYIRETKKGNQWDNDENIWKTYNLDKEQSLINEKNNDKKCNNKNKKKVTDDYYYNILEVNTDTNEKEIKKKYYKLAMKYHPDRNNNDCDKFKKINEAYQILGNEKMREEYDKYGMETVDKKRIIPGEIIFELMFGNDDFKFFIGDLYITFLFEEESQTEEDLIIKQKEREINLAINLKKLTDNFVVNGDKELFIQEIENYKEKLIQTDIGKIFIKILADIYKETATQHLDYYSYNYFNHFVRKYTSTVYKKYDYLFSFVKYFLKIMESDLNSNMNNKEFIENIIDISWKISIIDIEKTIRKCCTIFLKDESEDKNINNKRAEALLIISDIFIKNIQTKNEGINELKKKILEILNN